MSFGSPQQQQLPRNPDLPAYTPTRADASVITAGLYGLRPNRSPARSNNFSSGGGASPAVGRKPSTAKRSLIGGN